jgi:ATP-dependent DNA helicase RecG
MPSDSPPVKTDGRIWVRTGPRRSLANEQEERILNEKRLGAIVPFEIRPVYGAKLEDLSRAYFEDEYLPKAFAKDVLEANHRTYEERLAACKYIVSPDDTRPTFLGLMAIGKNPRYFIPGLYIQFLRIDGTTERDSILDSSVSEGRMMDMYKEAKIKFVGYNKIPIEGFEGAKQIKNSDYPETAYDQLLVNALLHRQYEGTNTNIALYWFNDRIEITSPGGPYGSVTIADFGKPGVRDYRNRNIADVIQNLDLMQRFGFGIQWARDSLAENGSPALEFVVNNSMVRAIIPKRK